MPHPGNYGNALEMHTTLSGAATPSRTCAFTTDLLEVGAHADGDFCRETDAVVAGSQGERQAQIRPSRAPGISSNTSSFFRNFVRGGDGMDEEGVGYRPCSDARPSQAGKAKKQTPQQQHVVFPDATALKAKVLQNLVKPEYNVANFYYTSGFFQAVARSPLFEQVTLCVITFNALWIAIDTDENDAKVITEAHPVFQVAENMFCTFFTTEWFIRFMAFRKKRNGLRDFWFVFDSILVALMVMETWVMLIVMEVLGGGGDMGDVTIIKLFRLVRLSRVARMARLLKSVPELMILIKGMRAAVRSVFFTLVLLFLAIYVFAIFFTQLTSDVETLKSQWFSTVWASAYTLLLRGVLLDSPTIIATALGQENPFFAVLFLLFVLTGALTVMNLLIGVLCEVVGVVAAVEKEEMLVTLVKSRLLHIVECLDENGDNQISRNEFMKILENPDAASALQEVGVDVVGLIDFADFIFECEDNSEEEEPELSFSDFMEVVLSLRGSNTATVKDVVDLRKFVRTTHISQSGKMDVTEQRLHRMEGNILRIEKLLAANLSAMMARRDSNEVSQKPPRETRDGKRSASPKRPKSPKSPKKLENLLSGQAGSVSLRESGAGFHLTDQDQRRLGEAMAARIDSPRYLKARFGARKSKRQPPPICHAMPSIDEAPWISNGLGDARCHLRTPSRPTQQPRHDAGQTPRDPCSLGQTFDDAQSEDTPLQRELSSIQEVTQEFTDPESIEETVSGVQH